MPIHLLRQIQIKRSSQIIVLSNYLYVHSTLVVHLKMKTSFVSLLLMSLLICSSFLLETSMADLPPSPSFSSSACGQKCAVRCSKAGRQDRCLKYCGICCAKCNCVPSGTYGNKAECPCYDNMKNSKGTPKCP